jgi:hypothetical protein
MLKEGETVASVRGTIVGISLSDNGRMVSRRRHEKANITVQPDNEEAEEYRFDLDAKQAAKLNVGQSVGIEIKVIAADT